MNCPNCGSQLPDGTTFCNACGTPIAEQSFQSANDALFNAAPVYSSAPAKKKGNKVGAIVGIIAVLAIAVVVAFFVLGGRYNGTYKFDSISAYGMELSLADLEQEAGESINMTLKVTFGRCVLDADMLGYSEKGGAKIKIKGDKVTYTDGNEKMTGTYDSDEKSITIEAEGVSMKFIKQ